MQYLTPAEPEIGNNSYTLSRDKTQYGHCAYSAKAGEAGNLTYLSQ
jgi:hypothetical protein